MIGTICTTLLIIFSYPLSNIVIGSEFRNSIYIFQVIIFIPFLIQLIKYIKDKKGGINSSINVKRLIDSFDNEICYYALMAESYYETFINLLGDRNTSIYAKQFYLIETGYYLNKTVMCLQPLVSSSTDVLSSKIDDIISKRMISYARYNNICDLLLSTYEYLKEHIEDLNGLEDCELLIETNKKMNEKLISIIGEIKRNRNSAEKKLSNTSNTHI